MLTTEPVAEMCKALAETPIVTSDGVKVTDAAWISARYAAELEGQHPAALERAPEICIEVLSPSNRNNDPGGP